ncbi:MAG: PulJ/GspJ family protein, partial [Lentisphaeria bacterium]
MKGQGKKFTIVELMVALAIFSIIMLVMMGIFDQAQRALRGSNSLTTVYENARVVFQTIEQDFINAVASSDHGQEIPFSITRDGFPCMVVSADIPDAKSRFIEVSYKIDTATIDGAELKDFDDNSIKYFKR